MIDEVDLLINFCSIIKVKIENKRIITIHEVIITNATFYKTDWTYGSIPLLLLKGKNSYIKRVKISTEQVDVLQKQLIFTSP